MASIIVLSSSPAQVFARSQTPNIVSSPRASDDQTITTPEKLFRPAHATRDGLSTTFSSARQVLGTKLGAENIPIRSPVKSKYRSPVKDSSLTTKAREDDIASHSAFHQTNSRVEMPQWNEVPEGHVVQIQPSDLRKNRRKKTDPTPLQIQKAVTRRKDWTPPKTTISEDLQELDDRRATSFSDRLTSFGHSDGNTSFEKSFGSDGALVKRRRIELVRTSSDTTHFKPQVAKTTKKRDRSIAKKPLTITELATSHYFGGNKKQETPMMQFLTSTQARPEADDNTDTLATKTSRRSASVKLQKKSRLKSPSTVMRTMQEQEIIFASASQLAREESPTLLKDTVEAIKQSESLLSDPFQTQQIEVISIESTTPKVGVSRFRGRRSLWAAADRDTEDALVGIEDAFDTPIPQPSLVSANKKREMVKPTIGINESGSESKVLDVDDLFTPATIRGAFPAVTKRQFSTAASPSRKRDKAVTPTADDEPRELPESIDLPKEADRVRPNFNGWTDEQLKKQVKAYGFKRIRARKRMLAILEQCWEEKNGTDHQHIPQVEPVSETGSEPKIALQHGVVLGQVHGLADRPLPKVKKARVKKVKSGAEALMTRRPGKVTKVSGSKATTTESRNLATPSLLKEDGVVDIDDLIAPQTTANIAETCLMSSEDSDIPLAVVRKKAEAVRRTAKLQTPPATPQEGQIASGPKLTTDLQTKISAALRHTSATSAVRNHQHNPTWHEKMLMYDPIVLEDFTAWLNTEGLNSVGEDREVDTLDVRAWCEAHGVCCLWKGGWRGNRKGKEKE